MADPASIIGTAVGITSLGIQVCQALSQYYSHFRTFDDEIGAIVQRLDGLSRTLEVLESLRPKIEIPGNGVSSQLQKAVEACAAGLLDLQKMAEECKGMAIPVTAEEKRRVLKKRLLWPFKQGTVANVVSTLNGLQANVQLAVQILDLEAGHRALISVETTRKALIAQVEHLHHNQVQALASFQQGFISLSDRLISNEATRVVREPTQLCSRVEDIEKKLIITLGVNAHYSDRDNTMRRHAVLSSKCDCRKGRRIEQHWRSIAGLLNVQVVRETQHKPTCEFYQYGDNNLMYEVDYQFLKKWLGLQLRAGISYARHSGSYTLQPMLSVKPIVAKTSPTFSPLYTIPERLGCTCGNPWLYCGRCGTSTNALRELEAALNKIIQCFRNGLGSPHDTLDRGPSVLDLAYDMAFHMIAAGHLDGQAATRLLATFIDHGRFQGSSELTSVKSGFETAPFVSTNLSTLEHASVLYAHRLSIADTWRDDWFTDHKPTSALKHQLLRSENNLSKYDNDCTLLTSIHRRSERALCEAIQIHAHGLCGPPGLHVPSGFLILAARHWSVGLRILLNLLVLRNRVSLQEVSKQSTLNFVTLVMAKDRLFESLDVLLKVLPSGYWSAFNSICRQIHYSCDTELISGFVRTMYHRNDSNEAQGLADEADLSTAPIPPSYFHAPNLKAASMQLLLDAGFSYADNPAHVSDLEGSRFGTPLWIQALQNLTVWYRSPDWKLLELMISKGARLDWEHPELHTTPAHLSCLSLWSRYNTKSLSISLLKEMVSCQRLDRCTCACSTNGCLAIGCAVGSLFETSHKNVGSLKTPGRELLLALFRALCDVVVQEPSRRAQTALAVLRVLTFDELGLTHTCCRRYIDREDAWENGIHVLKQDLEEVEAVRYSESKDLDTLEALMVELEHAWSEFHGPFLAFLRRIWLPLMQTTHEELSSFSESDIVQRTGQAEAYVHGLHGTDSESEAETVEEEGEKLLWQILMDLDAEDLNNGDDESQTLPPGLLETTQGSISLDDVIPPQTGPTSSSSFAQNFEHQQRDGHGSATEQRGTMTRRKSI